MTEEVACPRSARWPWSSARSTSSRPAWSSTLFTRELGKVAALAKGARRLKSPFQGGLDLLGVCDIVLLHKASEALDLVTEAAPVERFASLRRDLAALYAGYYIAELLADLTDFHDPHPKLFDAATVTLRHLGDAAVAAPAAAPVRAGLPARTGADAGASTPACTAARRSTRPATRDRSRSAWRRAGCSAPRAGPASRTWRRSRAGPWRRSASWRAPAAPGATSTLAPRPWRPVRATLGAMISHLLGHRPRLLPYLGA